jgi:predicted DNA-binding transcriptional regulator AlpA
MTHKLRFRDLKKRGIVENRPQLKNMIERYGFPRGKSLTPNCHVWDEEDEINPWIESRPTEGGSPLRGAAKAKHDARRRKAQPEAGA